MKEKEKFRVQVLHTKSQFVVGAFMTVLTWWLERKPGLTSSQVDATFRRLVLNGIGPSIALRPAQG